MVTRTLSLVLAACLFMPAAIMGKDVKKMGELPVTSPAFADKGEIPARYTCDGKNINPALEFGAVPAETRSLALIVDDPDAPVGTWVHWVVWNMDAHENGIRENSVPAGAVQGMNSWKRNTYGGPCPPSGTHRYYFKLYALDTALKLSPSAGKAELEKAMAGHILAKGQLMGTYRHR